MFVDTLLTIRIFLRKYRKGIFLVRKHMFLNTWTRFAFSNFGFRCIWVLQLTYNWRQCCKCYSMLVTFVWWRLFGGGSWNFEVSKFDPVVHDFGLIVRLNSEKFQNFHFLMEWIVEFLRIRPKYDFQNLLEWLEFS